MYVIHYIGGAVTVMKTSKKQAEQAVADLERRTVENAGRFPERILLGTMRRRARSCGTSCSTGACSNARARCGAPRWRNWRMPSTPTAAENHRTGCRSRDRHPLNGPKGNEEK